MKLTAKSVDAYCNDGQITAPFKLSEQTVNEIERHMLALFDSRPDLDTNYLPALIEKDRTWLKFAMLPEILNIVEQLIGPDIIVWSSALFCKSPVQGKTTPWHQDAQYWPIKPLETTTVWIAIDPATRDNGCLRIVPGSHKTREIYPHSLNNSDQLVLNQELDATLKNEFTPKDLVLERGMFSLHDAYIVHGAEPNRSGKRRAGLTFRYMPASSHFDRNLARKMLEDLNVNDVTERQLFLVRGTKSHPGNNLTPV